MRQPLESKALGATFILLMNNQMKVKMSFVSKDV